MFSAVSEGEMRSLKQLWQPEWGEAVLNFLRQNRGLFWSVLRKQSLIRCLWLLFLVMVPFLSPVRTQILMSALASLAMVSGTPS